jgi:hypothetical protein
MTSPIIASGSKAMTSLASRVIQYTGGDTRLGRRVRLGAALTLFALALHTVAIGVSGPSCSKKKRNAIRDDLQKVGKAVLAGDVVTESGDDRDGDFDEYDVVVVGGGTYAACEPRDSRLAVPPQSRGGVETQAQIVLRDRGLHPSLTSQRKLQCARSVAGSWSKVRVVPRNPCPGTLTAFPVLWRIHS